MRRLTKQDAPRDASTRICRERGLIQQLESRARVRRAHARRARVQPRVARGSGASDGSYLICIDRTFAAQSALSHRD